MVTLQTVETALAAMLSDATADQGWPPTSERFFRGEAQLQANTRRCWEDRPKPAASW